MNRRNLLLTIYANLQTQGSSALRNNACKRFIEHELGVEIRPRTSYVVFDTDGDFLGDSDDLTQALQPALLDLSEKELLVFAKGLEEHLYGDVVSSELKKR